MNVSRSVNRAPSRSATLLATGALLANGFAGVVVTAPVQAASSVSAYAIVGQLTGCADPFEMTVIRGPHGDDTVYVACEAGESVAVITDDSTDGQVDDSIPLWAGSMPSQLTSGDSGDTIYVLDADGRTIGAIAPGATSSDDSRSLNDAIFAIAASSDDTLYAAVDVTELLDGDDTIVVINPGFGSVDDSFGVQIEVFALAASDDTLYGFGYFPDTDTWGIGAINMLTNTLDDTAPIEGYEDRAGIYVSLAAGDTSLFVAGPAAGDDTRMWAINPQTLAIDDSVPLSISGSGSAVAPGGLLVTTARQQLEILDQSLVSLGVITMPVPSADIINSQAVTRSNVIYTGDYENSLIYRIAQVTSSLGASAGAAGDTVTLTVAPSASDVTVDDSTVVAVNFGNTEATVISAGRNSFDVTVPPGSGTVAVNIELNGVELSLIHI